MLNPFKSYTTAELIAEGVRDVNSKILKAEDELAQKALELELLKARRDVLLRASAGIIMEEGA